MSKFREDLAWAAGFFDGEGTFTLNNKTWARISINQVDVRPLERFKGAVCNVGNIYGPYDIADNRQPIYRYAVNGSYHCQAVVAMLWPFLCGIKKEQAKQMMTNMSRSNLNYLALPPIETKLLNCKRGHPYEGNRTKHGQCRECMRIADRKRYHSQLVS